jgi:hypothetical protein
VVESVRGEDAWESGLDFPGVEILAWITREIGLWCRYEEVANSDGERVWS